MVTQKGCPSSRAELWDHLDCVISGRLHRPSGAFSRGPPLPLPPPSKWVSELIGGRESIYERHIELNRYPFLDPKLEVTYPARSRAVIDGQQLQVCVVCRA